ncbi:putative transcriptional regulator [Caldisphaera lagunensis DSM 15908]|uniref:Putative transcriptional regulator n=1 Tax=Caldisphaera lagunensis (strain DSM 15908 / JCM 11604 / ANMR 0165 / IC-154) TaxID=1056495 RepID=L0ABF7_CALLD|nr:winged helix-turn-helix domain-containing protein [Caldisphaera lagunensis]AFZ71191.1 putative transcriptional regulator [Caldisphaera lagunensis DSM 15908]
MSENIPTKEGIYERDKVLYVIGPKAIAKVSSALASDTRAKILSILQKGPADLEDLANLVNQSKANVSSQIRRLEEVDIVRSKYSPGQRGIKKIVELMVNKMVMVISPDKMQEAQEKDLI